MARCSPDDYNSWRKKAFGSKPDLPGSTRSPQNEDPIDAEWKVFTVTSSPNLPAPLRCSTRPAVHLPHAASRPCSNLVANIPARLTRLFGLSQALQRGRATNSDPPTTSGRSEYGFSVEDSWDLADDTYTPFPGPPSQPISADSVALDHWSSSRRMAASSELWNRVSQVHHFSSIKGKPEPRLFDLPCISLRSEDEF